MGDGFLLGGERSDDEPLGIGPSLCGPRIRFCRGGAEIVEGLEGFELGFVLPGRSVERLYRFRQMLDETSGVGCCEATPISQDLGVVS